MSRPTNAQLKEQLKGQQKENEVLRRKIERLEKEGGQSDGFDGKRLVEQRDKAQAALKQEQEQGQVREDLIDHLQTNLRVTKQALARIAGARWPRRGGSLVQCAREALTDVATREGVEPPDFESGSYLERVKEAEEQEARDGR